MKEIINGAMCKMPDAPCNTLEEKIQRLLDIEEIKTIPFHYANYCDKLDAESISSIFTEERRLLERSSGADQGPQSYFRLLRRSLPARKIRNTPDGQPAGMVRDKRQSSPAYLFPFMEHVQGLSRNGGPVHLRQI